MIPIRPIPSDITVCPLCLSEHTDTKAIRFPGIHVVAEAVCHTCGYEFIQDLPVGHACYYPVSIGLKDHKVFDSFQSEWFTVAFSEAWQRPSEEEIKIDRIIRQEGTDIILINCLDYLYGHVLLKLFNLSFYRQQQPDKKLVVIVPSNFVWLVPEYIQEIWAVPVKLSNMRHCYSSIDTQINQWLTDYKNVQLGYTYPHPYTEDVIISDYTGIEPFDKSFFLETPLTVTFIYRTDRLWLRNRLQHLMFLAFRKVGLKKYVPFLFPGIQDRAVRKTEKVLRKKHPDMIFRVAGLGTSGNMGHTIEDLRTSSPDTETEHRWCQAYASSHVVIGMHGSNMLLPSALAAAVVELLPADRTGNRTQDISTSQKGRMALYLTRFIPDTSSASDVALEVDAIFKGYSLFQLYNDPVHHVYAEDIQQRSINATRMNVLKNLFRTKKNQ